MSRRAEVLVVGGGPAGCAAAVPLARAGCETVLIEREARPTHKVCGEFLSQEALESLQALGLDLAALGAVPLHGVRLADARSVTSAPLPFAAMSLTRRTLDEALLQRAAHCGVTVMRGVRVRTLQRDATGGWTATLDDGSAWSAATAFLATGKHDLSERPRPAGAQGSMVGFKMYWQLAEAEMLAVQEQVELCTYPGGYGGLQAVEDGTCNFACLIDRRVLQRLGGRWEQLLTHMQHHCPHLRLRLQGARPVLDRPLAVAPIPYGYVRSHTEAGLWQLGDQAAVIPSFTGDGMSIALHSGAVAASMYLAGATAESFQKRLHRDLCFQVGLATAVSRGLVWPPTRGLMMAAVRRWPEVLGAVAMRTRISRRARRTLRPPVPPHTNRLKSAKDKG